MTKWTDLNESHTVDEWCWDLIQHFWFQSPSYIFPMEEELHSLAHLIDLFPGKQVLNPEVEYMEQEFFSSLLGWSQTFLWINILKKLYNLQWK